MVSPKALLFHERSRAGVLRRGKRSRCVRTLRRKADGGCGRPPQDRSAGNRQDPSEAYLREDRVRGRYGLAIGGLKERGLVSMVS